MRRPSAGPRAAVLVGLLLAGPHATAACGGKPVLHEVSAPDLKARLLATGQPVLSFAGYSGAAYENPDAMLSHARRELARHRPAHTLVNIGATAVGIGQVYELAKRLGFSTIGIVSTLARDEQVELSPCVDVVYFVPDAQWGGLMAGSGRLSPTSQAIVDVSAFYVAIGGGDVTRDEALAMRRAGKSMTFVPADMNHGIAIEKARKAGHPVPTDFRGSAHKALVAPSVPPRPAASVPGR